MLKGLIDTIEGIIIGGVIGIVVVFSLSTYFPYEYNYYFNKLVNNIDAKTIAINDKNEYARDINFNYVQNTTNFYPTNQQDLLNILYTFLNSGQEEFTFYCSKEYTDCTKDMSDLIYDEEKNVLGYIYEFNHPYNDFKTISAGTNKDTGKVTLKVTHKYTQEEIETVNKKVDELYDILVDPNDTDYNNILRIHNYLVENIEYDKVKRAFIRKESDIDSEYKSNSAYGALIEHMAICSGYTDAFALFLEKMGIENYRIATQTHIWNAVKLDGTWYHIDLTWDDGRYTNGKTFTSYKYFLIGTADLLGLNMENHNFNQEMYSELKVD